MRRKHGLLAVAVVLALASSSTALVAPTAQARVIPRCTRAQQYAQHHAACRDWTFDQAFNATWNRAISFCNSFNGLQFECVRANYPYAPRCTDVDSDAGHGETQWVCYGTAVQEDVLSGEQRTLYIQVNWDPYGVPVYSYVDIVNGTGYTAKDYGP